jgi:hypothetical protein
MARKISEHPEVAPGTVFDGTEVALFNKGGVTYKSTLGALLDYKANASDLDLFVPNSLLAEPLGVATLGPDGKLVAGQMPAGIDAVQEYANVAAFPATGASNIIYLAADTSKSYRWGTTVYVEIVASPGSTDAVPEGTTNLYFTPARVRSVVLTGLSLVTNAAIAATDTVLGALGKLQKQITDHFGSGGTAHALATTSVAGFLSAADKTKLDALTPGGGGPADTLSGGLTGQIPYQSAPDTTAFNAGLVFDGTSALTLGPQGGNAIFRAAGPANATSPGGQVSIVAGVGGATSGNGGAITLTSGTASGSGSVGAITVKPGNGVAANSSVGTLMLSGGDSSGNAGGSVTLKGGNSASGAFAGGSVNISGGSSAAGAGGAIILSTDEVERLRILEGGAWSVGTGGTATGTLGKVVMSAGPSAPPSWQLPSLTIATAIPSSTIDLSLGSMFTKTVSGAVTLAVSNVPTTGTSIGFILDLTNGGSSVVTWWSGMKWTAGVAPVLTAAGRDVLAFFTHDGGTTWTGLVLGLDVK